MWYDSRVQILPIGAVPVSALAFSSDGWHLYAGCDDGSLVRVHADGRVDSVGSFHRRVHAIAARPNSDDVYACCEQWIATINPESPPGKPDVLAKRTQHLTAIAFATPDVLVSGTGHLAKVAGGGCAFDDLAKNKTIGRAYNEAGGIRALAAHPGTPAVAWATGDRAVRVLPLAKPDSVKIAFDQNANALAFSPDGTRLALALGRQVRIVDWRTQQLRGEAIAHTGRVGGVQYLPDGSILSAAWDEAVLRSDANGQEPRPLSPGIGKLTCLAVSPDGTKAATGSATGHLAIWDLA